LDRLTPEFRNNVQARGREFMEALQQLKSEFPHVVADVKGTGLLLAASIHDRFRVVGESGLEQQMRRAGVGVIHGGKNALRFTPHFLITSEEIQMIVGVMRTLFRRL